MSFFLDFSSIPWLIQNYLFIFAPIKTNKLKNIMIVTVKHNHSKEEATERAKKFLQKLKEENGSRVDNLQENWNGSIGNYSCTFNGMKFAAKIVVKDDEVVVDGKVPFFALPFKGVIENAIRDSMLKAMK